MYGFRTYDDDRNINNGTGQGVVRPCPDSSHGCDSLMIEVLNDGGRLSHAGLALDSPVDFSRLRSIQARVIDVGNYLMQHGRDASCWLCRCGSGLLARCSEYFAF